MHQGGLPYGGERTGACVGEQGQVVNQTENGLRGLGSEGGGVEAFGGFGDGAGRGC